MRDEGQEVESQTAEGFSKCGAKKWDCWGSTVRVTLCFELVGCERTLLETARKAPSSLIAWIR